MSALANRLAGLYSAFAARFTATFATPSSQKGALVTALVVVGAIVVFLIAALVFLPSQRKVVLKRRVRRIRRKVVAQPVSSDVEATPPASSPRVRAARSGRGLGVAASAAAWILLVIISAAGAYFVTGTNRYCGESCHAADPQVAQAVKGHHADCIDCHESNPVSGVVARVQMALAPAVTNRSVVANPVDPDRCLRCHGNVVRETVTTKAGLIVSHKEILAGGRTCQDCHVDAGHRKGTAIVGGMSRCTSCHDGTLAKRTCQTCHVGGSPLSVAGAATKARSSFDYGPAIRVANRDCARCHGAETKCRACHNGLVLPHPKAFVQGGHARMAAFGGKEKCFKCHSLTWCGNDACHHSFSAHNETAWAVGHRNGTSEQCGSCHMSWNGKGDFCKVCH